MGKKRSAQQNQTGPDLVDMDALASMSDDELSNRFQRLEAEREALREQRVYTKSWEIEIAYVRREQQLRRTRRELHDAYLAAIRDEAQVDVLSDEYDDVVSNDVDAQA